MNPIGIGIAGAGHVADIHARVYHELAGLGVKLVGVVAQSKANADKFAAHHGVERAVADFTELLQLDGVDIIDICAPNRFHRDFALQAARMGKHIICEKPLTGYFGLGEAKVGHTSRRQMLAAALHDADQMVTVAAEHKIKLMYAENWLYSPVIQKAKRLIRTSGGTIFQLCGEESHHGSHSSAAKSWRNSGGGALIRLGSHPIGAILHLKQCEGIWRDGKPITPQTVLADVANLTEIESFRQSDPKWVVNDWDDVENWSQVTITFSDGSKGVVAANDICIGGMKDTLDIYLSNARMHCDFSRTNTLQAYAPDATVFEGEYLMEKLETQAGWSFPSVDEEWFLGYRWELQDFVEAVKFDREPLADGRLGRDVVNVIYSAYLSAAEGRLVRLDQPD